MKRLLLALLVPAALAQDTELTNWKTGIDLHFGDSATTASDKGSGYMEEYLFHDKLVNDTKTVYILDTTDFTFSHNARNVAITPTSGRDREVVGSSGGGTVRYKIDGIWQEKPWSQFTGRYPAYSAPFNLSDAGVVGVTGYNSGGNYWQGLVDSVGDEWHVMQYGDDDEGLGSASFPESAASDGKYVVLCVNPTTPAMTVRADTGKFYTTPAWTWWVPKIHDQTTYFEGTVDFELRDINGGNISYRINSGSTVNVGASTVTLDETDFSDGSNTLEYWFTATPGTVRTRTVVENPTHPSAGETHGEIFLGGASGWAAFQSRTATAPYSTEYTSSQDRGNNGQTTWDSVGGNGYRFGYPGAGPWSAFGAGTNAILSKSLGNSAYATGSPGNKTYAAYSKEMLLESALNQHPIGYEQFSATSAAIPSFEVNYRGYYDANYALDAVIAYDVLVDTFRSDSVSGGITPVEDYFLRDMLASWCHLAALQLSGVASSSDTGLGTTSRAIVAAMIGAAMPSYSTSYYGTSGFDGTTTTVYQWAPFQGNNFTWKEMFLDDSHTTQATDYVSATFPMGLEGTTQYTSEGTQPLIRTSETYLWADKTSYASWGQCAKHITNYALLIEEFGNWADHAPLVEFIDQITAGDLYGAKKETGGSVPSGPQRVHMILLLQSDFPTAATNMTSYMQGLSSGDNTEANAISEGGLRTLAYYDDSYFGAASAPSNNSAPSISGTETENEVLSASTGAWSGSPTPTYTYQWQRDTAGDASYSNISGATSSTYTLTSSDTGNKIRVVVTATNSEGSASANSSPTGLIAKAGGGGPGPGFSVQSITTGTLNIGN